MNAADLLGSSAAAIAHAVRTRAVSAAAMVEASLDRIQASGGSNGNHKRQHGNHGEQRGHRRKGRRVAG